MIPLTKSKIDGIQKTFPKNVIIGNLDNSTNWRYENAVPLGNNILITSIIGASILINAPNRKAPNIVNVVN